MSEIAFRFDNVVNWFGKTEALRGFTLSVPDTQGGTQS